MDFFQMQKLFCKLYMLQVDTKELEDARWFSRRCMRPLPCPTILPAITATSVVVGSACNGHVFGAMVYLLHACCRAVYAAKFALTSSTAWLLADDRGGRGSGGGPIS